VSSPAAACLATIDVVHSARVWLPQTQTWMCEQTRRLPEHVTSHIVCERTENLDQFAVPNVHSAASEALWRRGKDFLMRASGVRHHLALLAKVIDQTGAGVVHSHFGHIGWLDLGALRGRDARHVVSFYGADLSLLPRIEPQWHERYPQLFTAVDRVLCEGPFMAGTLAGMGCPREKITVHHLGVDLDKLAYRPRHWQPGTPLRVLLCGTFTEKKGFPDALEALARLMPTTPLQITIIGDAGDDPRQRAEKQRMLEVIERRRLPVDLRGILSHREIIELGYEHHVLVSPSITAADGDSEGGAPVTIIEMAATGMPIVATQHCDIPEVLPEGTGWLARERDTVSLINQLRELVDMHGNWIVRLARARDHIEHAYDSRRQGERLAELYRELAQRDGVVNRGH